MLFCSVLVCLLLSEVSARKIDTIGRLVRSVRVERNTYVCEGDEGKLNFLACMEKARADFNAAVEEDDGRPDLVERKTCNLITDTVQECGRHLYHCYIEEAVEPILDSAVKEINKAGEKNSLTWDPEKCPVVKEVLERNRPKRPQRNGSEIITLSSFALVTISVFMNINLMA